MMSEEEDSGSSKGKGYGNGKVEPPSQLPLARSNLLATAVAPRARAAADIKEGAAVKINRGLHAGEVGVVVTVSGSGDEKRRRVSFKQGGSTCVDGETAVEEVMPGEDVGEGNALTRPAAPTQLTADQVRDHHVVMDRLSHIRNMHEAVNYEGVPGVGVFWDFKHRRAVPGRLWLDRVPEEWRHELERDYTAEELRAARDLTGIDASPSVPPGRRPHCVLLLGPPGSGKSTCLPKAAGLLGLSLDSYVLVDGDNLRSCHAAWVRRVDEQPLYGYWDSFKVFKTAQKKYRGKHDTLKVELTTEALDSRKNVIVCDTKINQHILHQIRSKQYDVVVIGLLISQEESRCRNQNRGQEIGRVGDASPKAWTECMDAIKLLTRPEESDRVVIMDSTDLSNPKVVFSRVHTRADMERAIEDYASNMDWNQAARRTSIN